MGNPLRSLFGWLKAEDIDVNDEELEAMDQTPPPPVQDTHSRSRRGPMLLRSHDGTLEIRHPRSLEDRLEIGTALKQRHTVMLDLTQLQDHEARFFLAFMYGVVFALDGTAEKVTEGIYVLAPHGVAVNNDAPQEAETASSQTSARPAARAAAAAGGYGQEELFWHSR